MVVDGLCLRLICCICCFGLGCVMLFDFLYFCFGNLLLCCFVLFVGVNGFVWCFVCLCFGVILEL